MSKNDPTFIETRLVGSNDNRSMAVTNLVDVNRVFVPADRVQRIDHAELIGCQSESGNVDFARFFGSVGSTGGQIESLRTFEDWGGGFVDTIFFFGSVYEVLVALGAVEIFIDIFDCSSHFCDEWDAVFGRLKSGETFFVELDSSVAS